MAISTTIVLVRHGRTAFNREGVFRGRMDVPLDDTGREQAQAAARLLRDCPLEAVYSSPLARARNTAEPIARLKGLEVVLEEPFTNLDLGPWTGRRHAEVAREEPQNWKLWIEQPEDLVLPGAETLDQVADRSSARLAELVERHAEAGLAIVSHRAVLKPLLARVLDLGRPWFWRFTIEPGSISRLTHQSGRGYTLSSLNETNHLTGEPGSPDDA